MRGKLLKALSWVAIQRITPADAGKTDFDAVDIRKVRDHPRGCGENYEQLVGGVETLGSPPRMRGKPPLQPPFAVHSGITPADAGKTDYRPLKEALQKDHPRGCGENTKKIL